MYHVHARGQIKFLDEAALIELLKKLSLHFENNNTNSSTVYDNLPVDYKEKLIKAILAFEIEVTEMDNVYKLSQNRNEKSYDSIVQRLKQQEGDARRNWRPDGKTKRTSLQMKQFFLFGFLFLL